MPTGDPVIALPTCMNIACIDFHSTPLHLYPNTLNSLPFTVVTNASCELLTWITCRYSQPTLNNACPSTTSSPIWNSSSSSSRLPSSQPQPQSPHKTSHGRLQHTQSSPLSLIPTLPSSPHTQQRNESPRQSHSRRPDCHTQDQQNVTTIEGSVRPYKLDPFEC